MPAIYKHELLKGSEKRNNTAQQKEGYARYFILLFLLLLCSQTIAKPLQLQISRELYEQLPESARPVNRLSIKGTELRRLLIKLDQFNLPKNITELDSLCSNAAHQYIYLDTRTEQCEYLDAILNYYYYRHRGSQPDFVIRYSDTLLRLVGKSQKFNNIRFEVYHHRASIFVLQERFIDAYNSNQQALELAKQINDPYQMSLAYGGLYMFFAQLMAYDKALIYLDKYWQYLQVQKTLPLLEERQYYLMFKSQAYIFLYRDSKKQAYLDSAIHLMSLCPHDSIYSVFKKDWFVQLSELSYHSGNFKQSIIYADSAFNQETKTGDYHDDVRKSWQGLSLLKIGKTKEGLALLQTINFDDLAPPTDIVLETLNKYYRENGLFEKALTIQEKISKYKEQSILNKNRLLAFEVEQKYNLDSKRKQIDLLKERSLKNTWLSVFIISSICLLLLILFLRSRESRKRSKMLIKQLEEKVEFEIIRIREKEQDLQIRIGQTIHDDFAGTIAGVVHFLNARALDKGEGKAYSKLATELHKSYERARKYSHDLFYEENQKNFWDELENSIKLFFIDTKTTLNLVVDEVTDHISPQIKVTILLVIKEALTNILKHARANVVDITIYEENQAIHLFIKDNGTGYTQKAKPGLGIQSIRKRIEDIGGDFNIYAMKGDSNTCLEIKIPHPTQIS